MFNPSRLTEPPPGETTEASVLGKGPNGDTRSAGMYPHHCGRSVATVCDDSVAARASAGAASGVGASFSSGLSVVMTKLENLAQE